MTSFDQKRIFVTGGTGFFGKSLLDFLKSSKCRAELWLLSRDPDGFRRRHPEYANHPGWHFWKGDARDFPLPPVGFDYVIHAASCAADDPDVVCFTCTSAIRVLELASRSGARTVFLSSGAVYGPLSRPALETDIPMPATPYGHAKLAAEQLFLESGLPAAAARCFSFIGPHISSGTGYAAADFLAAAAEHRPLRITGNAETVRSYLSAGNWAAWILALLKNGGGVWNVGSPLPVSVGELAGRIAALRGLPVEDCGIAAASYYVPDVDKIRREFRLEVPADPIPEIEKTLQTFENIRKKTP
ncbi:MAG: NAD-dependent epimerase/dehydratase family protein [Victivallaceae bacterium]|nr:NAD(P)-dependent oxidoreductase [Victivallaceae bacterium]